MLCYEQCIRTIYNSGHSSYAFLTIAVWPFHSTCQRNMTSYLSSTSLTRSPYKLYTRLSCLESPSLVTSAGLLILMTSPSGQQRNYGSWSGSRHWVVPENNCCQSINFVSALPSNLLHLCSIVDWTRTRSDKLKWSRRRYHPWKELWKLWVSTGNHRPWKIWH